MKKTELLEKVNVFKTETAEALQEVYDALNQGQQKKLLNNDHIKKLFDKYGVKY